MPIPGFSKPEEEKPKGPITSDFEASPAKQPKTFLAKLAEDRGVVIDRNIKKLGVIASKQAHIAKVVKTAARIADLITDEDRVENLRVIRDAKKARIRIYDAEQRKHIMVPDAKVQLAAVTLQLAYDEGLPVQRSIAVTGSFKDAGELLATLNESPAAREALKMLSNMGVQVVNDGEIIELEQTPENQEDTEE